MARVKLIVPLIAFCTALAVLALGRQTVPSRIGIGPAPIIAATPAPLTATTACDGTIKIGASTVSFAKFASVIANLTTFSFYGTETDIEGGNEVTFSFSGAYGSGTGPGPQTFSTHQKACTICGASSPDPLCRTIAGCKVLVGHPELATQAFSGQSTFGGKQASFVAVSPTGAPAYDRTVLCNSYPAP